MQATWKGIISFGLVSIPVGLFKATEEHGGMSLHQVHAADGSRVRRKLWCEQEDREVPFREVVKGYKAPDGREVVLTGDDLADLPLPSRRRIDVLAFVDTAELDPVMFGQAYYVGAADHAAADKPYVLLREALVHSGRVAVTKVTLSTRESLAVLRAHGDLLILQLMHWPQDVREPAGIAPEDDVSVRPQELQMAESLMEIQSEGFELSDLHDEYQAALRQVVDAKLAGVEPPHGEEVEESTGQVIDLMAALRSSVAAAKKAVPAREKEAAPKPARKAAEQVVGKKAAAASRTKKAAADAPAKKTAKKAPGRRRVS